MDRLTNERHSSTMETIDLLCARCRNSVESVNVGNYLLCGIKPQLEELTMICSFKKPLGSDCSLAKRWFRSYHQNTQKFELRALYFNPDWLLQTASSSISIKCLSR